MKKVIEIKTEITTMTDHSSPFNTTLHALTWRNQDEQPKTIGEIALIALIDSDGQPYLHAGLFRWDGDNWSQEFDSKNLLNEIEFMWLPELVLLRTIPISKKT